LAPLEPYERVLLDNAFREKDPHGEIACEKCHGGNPKASTMNDAHTGLVADPTYPDPSKACGACHEKIVARNKTNVHVSLNPYKYIIGLRASNDQETRKKIFKAMDTHCMTCHSSCGQCHVSRPNSVAGGVVQGHVFLKKPPMETNCTSCHGSRVEMEYLGKNKGIPGDVHYTKRGMKCIACHSGDEMHGTGKDYTYRYDVENAPRCEKCHEDAVSPTAKTQSHRIHRQKISCQVCHAVAYKNCYNCHVGLDAKGLPYFKTDKSELALKIGRNPLPSERRPYTFVTLRHVPVNRGLFDFYVKDGLTNFDVLPTWKLTTPHNIQRKTPQTKSCTSCHREKALFLLEKDVAPEERGANKGVMVPNDAVPRQQ
jgi:hypothetical protein